jgi:hypothetical protein
MVVPRFTRTLACLLALGAPLAAATLEVPGQFATLQGALDSAAPGDVIVVTGGVWNDVVVGEAVTIQGRIGQEPVIRCTGAGGAPYAALRLDGPGAGVVQLDHLRIEGGSMDGALFTEAFKGVRGGGFDELRLFDCEVEGGEWVAPTGVHDGADAVEVTVPYTVIQGCTLTGREGVGFLADGAAFQWDVADSGDAVRSTGDVAVFASTLVGADGVTGTVTDPADWPFFPPLWGPSIGGDGVQASGKVWHAQVTFDPGQGFLMTCPPCGDSVMSQPGQPVRAAGGQVSLLGDVSSAGPPRLGQTWTLSFTELSDSSLLVLGLPGAPLKAGGGVLFLDVDELLLAPLSGPGHGDAVPLAVPTDASLLGLTVGAQIYALGVKKLLNPVFGTLID